MINIEIKASVPEATTYPLLMRHDLTGCVGMFVSETEYVVLSKGAQSHPVGKVTLENA